MSYNIDSEECLVLDARMKAGDVVRILRDHEDELAECNFLNEINDEHNLFDPYADEDEDGEPVQPEFDPEMLCELPNFWWYGEGSGRSEDFLLKEIAPYIQGRVEAILYWEGGDSVSGVIIEDGDVYEAEVVQSLDRGKRIAKSKIR